MEVDAFQFESHLLDLVHSRVNFFICVNVISKFAREGGRKVVSCFFFDGDSPQNLHIGGQLLDFDQFINGIGSGIFHTVLLCPHEVTLILDGIRVHNLIFVGTYTHHSFQFVSGSAIESCSISVKVVQDGEGGI